jgi:hypothetical protein
MNTQLENSESTSTNVSIHQRLVELEHIINANLSAFYAVGRALREIKNSHLYKLQGFSRFEDYCAERWDMHYSHAKRLEAASIVVENLKNSPNWRGVLPQNESQVRPLTRLKREQQCQIWDRVIELAPVVQDRPKISAKLVEETVANMVGIKTNKANKANKKDKTANPDKGISFSVEIEDSLNQSLEKIHKMIDNNKREKVSTDLMMKIILKKALEELEIMGTESEILSEILAAIEN